MKTAIILCVVTLLMVSGVVPQGKESDRTWGSAWQEALEARDAMIKAIRRLRRGTTVTRMRSLMYRLDQLPSKIKGLDDLDVSHLEGEQNVISYLLKVNTIPSLIKGIYRERNLEADYSDGLGFLIKTFQGYHKFRCVQALYSSYGSLQHYNLPLNLMCSKMARTLNRVDSPVFSTDKVCITAKQCSGITNAHPYGDITGTSLQTACTEENHCKVDEALPLMGALLWYKASTYIAQSLCHNVLRQPPKFALDTEHQEIEAMVRSIMAFASTLSWDLFFREAANRRAYSNLNTALGLMEEYEKSFVFSSVACFDLQADDVCIYADINKEYQSIRKVQKYRRNPTNTRNLRHYAKVNHVKMIELKRKALQHIDLLGNIRSVNENLEGATEGLRNYLQNLAEYDQGIAEQDVAFLAGKLDEFEKQSRRLSFRVQRDVQGAMAAMVVNVGFDLAQKLVVLAAEIGEHANPLKTIFGGADVDDIYEKSVEVAEAINSVAHGAALLNTFSAVYTNMSRLARKFKDNANQIANLQVMVDAIKSNTIDKIGIDADNFIQAYGSYTPKVDRHMLAQNDALWGAYKDSTCDLLFGAEGIPASIGQGVVGGMLLCENLEASLAEFAALRENIFDFQFDLVDALAQVVRGNVAKKLSAEIQTPNKPLESSTLMLGFFTTHRRLQSEASLYCDKLEYKNQGMKIKVCSPESGLFSPTDLDELLAYNPDTTYHLDERFVYLPTKPQFNGDTGFVSLARLKKGEPVTFRMNGNWTWLRQYNWLTTGQRLAPFVESFKLYLPHKERAREFSKTRLTLTSIAGSAVSDKSDVVYNLPLEESHYVSVYSEGYNPSRCPSGKEITNPYSLCNNLPNICDTTTRVPGTSMMPTILSTWKLTYTKESPTDAIPWDAPDPATNLLLVAKVKLRFLPEFSAKRVMTHQRDAAHAGCCTGNNYRSKWNDMACVPCPSKPRSPTDSIMELGGYYCAKGSDDAAGEPIDYPDLLPE